MRFLKHSWVVNLITLSFIFMTNIAADEAGVDGAALHTDNCTGCHIKMTGGDGSILYTRNDHKVTSFSALETQVRRCENNIGLTWFDDQIFAVRDYLNSNHYHFDTK